MALPDAVIYLHQAFKNAGHKLYVVGGAVRDFLSNRQVKDIDLVTDVVPNVVEQILHEYSVPTRATGKAFGVIVARLGNNDYEIATFRKDSKAGDGRRPDSVTFSNMVEDAKRRDFTQNALYYNIETGEISDFHDGVAHIEQKKIVFIGDPYDRLAEDRLRALRFARFHCRYGVELDNSAAIGAVKACTLRPAVSEERIREEFIKGLYSAQDCIAFVRCLNELGLLGQVFDGLEVDHDLKLPYYHGGLMLPFSVVVAQIVRNNDVNLIVERLTALKYPIAEINDVRFLAKLPHYSSVDFVKFRRDYRRCLIEPKLVCLYAQRLGTNAAIIYEMINFPYPNHSGDAVMKDGFVGPEIGKELERRELESFLKSRNNEISEI